MEWRMRMPGFRRSRHPVDTSSPEPDKGNNVPLTVLRLTVLCMLSLTAGLLGYFAHKLLRDREILTFEVQYEASVVQLGDALRKGFAAKAKAAELAAFLFKFPPGGRKFHSDLQRIAEFELKLSGGRAISLVPFVNPSTRDAYEQFLADNWEGFAGLNELTPEDSAALTPAMRAQLNATIRGGIFGKVGAANFRVPPEPKPQFAPVGKPNFWAVVTQIAPMVRGTDSNWPVIGYDLRNETNRIITINQVVETNQTCCTDIIQLVQDTALGQTRAAGLMCAPSFWTDPATGERTLTALATVVFNWDQVLSQSLPTFITGIEIVMSGPRTVYTLEVNGGQVLNKGYGDHHEGKLDQYERTLSVSAGTNFTFKVYPRMSFKNSYLSKEPENETIGVVVIIAGVTAVFALYDYLSNHRMRALSAFANITSKMVDDVFPRTVKERLMRAKQKEVSQAQEERKASSPSGRGGLIVGLPGTSNAHAGDGAGGPDALGNGGAGAGRNRRGSIGVQIFTGMSGFLSSRLSVSSRNGTPKQRSRDGRFSLQDRPIADHFPSVCFSDFEGFTSWSSSVSPETVFAVLEQYFRLFDELARKLGIFKVETIGDCYMCVCGLPMPMKDHAVRMADFALGMLECAEVAGMRTGVKLRMRVGFHSGGVVAGVIRADKGRFQLFGDTVNTASRMESTGVPTKIQVSAASAALLEAAGTHVLEYRGKVAAKGKGEVDTYWLVGRGDDREDGTVSTATSSEVDDSCVTFDVVDAMLAARELQEMKKSGVVARGDILEEAVEEGSVEIEVQRDTVVPLHQGMAEGKPEIAPI